MRSPSNCGCELQTNKEGPQEADFTAGCLTKKCYRTINVVTRLYIFEGRDCLISGLHIRCRFYTERACVEDKALGMEPERRCRCGPVDKGMTQFFHHLTYQDRQVFHNHGCQQSLSRAVRGSEDTDCKDDILYLRRFRISKDQPWQFWPFCERHMLDAKKGGAQMESDSRANEA
jgi:hypothetical protein